MSTKGYKQILIEKLDAYLKPLGFKRKGNSYQKSYGDLTHYITLQSSVSSTAHILKITANVEIASNRLAMLGDDRLPIHLHRHYNKRIGRYLDEPHDKWFLMDNNELAKMVSEQILELIKYKVLPELEQLKSTDDLVYLWNQGYSPGITEGQRKRYLELLSNPEKG